MEEGKIGLIKSQMKWEEFAFEDANLDMQLIIAEYEGGTLGGIDAAEFEYERYKRRAYELKTEYEFIQGKLW